MTLMKTMCLLICLIGISFLFGCVVEPVSTETEGEVAESFEADPQPVPEQEVTLLEIGAAAPDFRLPGVDGDYHQLSDFEGSEVLVVIFTCNHCPTAQAYEERIKQFVSDYQDRGVAVVGISPNSPIALLHEECGYSDMGDTFEDMQIRARDHEFNFPYLYDGDDHAVSLQYGPVATPHAFVFDSERKLRYVGRLDGSEKPGTANSEDLRGAVDAVLAGEPVAVEKTKSFGCSVKWGWKTEWKKDIDKQWEAAEVTLTDIDVDGIKELLKNDSEKLRLINVWATWCGPCVIEYPELVVIHRMFKDRAFEFVSLSADSPESRDDVLKFLEGKHSALKNYLFSGEDQYQMIEAIDPEWEGVLPYTLLIEPGGNVIYRRPGLIDPLELKRVIVDHPMIGRYY